ncbi:MAG: universal stress protein [Acidobacteria bacterium]|nr:universal stress protein [Acidobacteriota bacterium]
MYPYRNILFCTDFSPLSRSMLKYAAAFARAHNARLYIHNVQEGTLPPQALRLSERALSEHGYEWLIAVRHELEEIGQHEVVKGLDVHLLLTEGNPADEIARVAIEHQIDLVTIATQNRSTLGRAMVGSTCVAILEKIKCPVLVSRQPAHDFVFYRGSETTIALNRILFATDFSDDDAAAKAVAINLAREHHSRLIFTHALGVFLNYVRAVTTIGTEDIESHVRKEATGKLAALQAEAEGIESKTVLGEGRTYSEVLRIAKESDVDLIVVGTGNRQTGNVLGRNTERIMRDANCPVLIVPS